MSDDVEYLQSLPNPATKWVRDNRKRWNKYQCEYRAKNRNKMREYYKNYYKMRRAKNELD